MFPGANGAGTLEAIHFRHRTIHEDKIVALGLDGMEGLPAIRNRVAGQFEAPERLDDDLAVDRVVIGHEHEMVREFRQRVFAWHRRGRAGPGSRH